MQNTTTTTNTSEVLGTDLFQAALTQVVSRVVAITRLLENAGICALCHEELRHDVDEPFAHCACGTTEWTGDPPIIFSLRREIQKLKTEALAKNERQ